MLFVYTKFNLNSVTWMYVFKSRSCVNKKLLNTIWKIKFYVFDKLMGIQEWKIKLSSKTQYKNEILIQTIMFLEHNSPKQFKTAISTTNNKSRIK